MKHKNNYAKINDKGKLEIYTDNAVIYEGVIDTIIANRIFEISGQDLMKIYAMLNDR